MMKHIGKHDQKKAIILFKQVPNEDHMCLIIYPDTLPRLYHDSVMRVIESEVGQNALEISDPLGRELMDDGRNVLEAMHNEGFIRKVPTNQTIVTPNVNTTIRLDELNKILAEMAQGDEAKKKLKEYDDKLGMQTKVETPAAVNTVVDSPAVTADGVLTDEGIAQSQISQAAVMEADAARLLAEAKNLKAEAYKMAPSLAPKVKRAVKKTAKNTVKKTVKVAKKAKNAKAS